jgi:hypothetical protein
VNAEALDAQGCHKLDEILEVGRVVPGEDTRDLNLVAKRLVCGGSANECRSDLKGIRDERGVPRGAPSVVVWFEAVQANFYHAKVGRDLQEVFRGGYGTVGVDANVLCTKETCGIRQYFGKVAPEKWFSATEDQEIPDIGQLGHVVCDLRKSVTNSGQIQFRRVGRCSHGQLRIDATVSTGQITVLGDVPNNSERVAAPQLLSTSLKVAAETLNLGIAQTEALLCE